MTTKLLVPRGYQRDGVDAVRASWAGGMRRPAVVWPTGTGKTVGFSHLATEWLAENPGKRVLILAHREELLTQAAAKLAAVAPHLSVGIIQGKRNETLADVVVASVMTLKSPQRRLMLRDVGMIIVDECHHAPSVTYVAILRHFGALSQPDGTFSADCVAVGFTATMVRGDDKALGDIWQDVVHSMSISDAIHQGFLVRPRGKLCRVKDLDLAGVKRSRGDYQAGALGDAITDSMAPELIAKAVNDHAYGRPTILFAPTVATAISLGTALSDAGRRVGVVSGAMTPEARRAVLRGFSEGEYDLLSNCMVATEGYDETSIGCVVIARPTTSSGLYVQMIGRGLRPHPGKSDCIVIDVVGASRKHSLASHVELFGESVLDDFEDEITEKENLLDGLDDGELIAATALGLDIEETYATGELIVEEIEMLAARSQAAWMKTYGGIWFLPAGDRLIAIVPGVAVNSFNVVTMPGQGWVIEGVTDLSYAMAWGEQQVTAAEQTIARKDRPWRRQKPTDKQLWKARRMGVIVPEGASGGEVSNLIAVAVASSRIDPPTAQWMEYVRRARASM